jgi:hypothetical protein
MNVNAVLVAVTSLSLGATCYLIASLPRGDDGRITDLERRLDAAERRADAVESLRGEMHEFRTVVERRMSAPAETAAPEAAAIAGRPGRADAAPASGTPVRPLEDVLAERVEKKVAEKMDALAARDRERGEDGKWKAPIDDLAKEIGLSDAQKAEAKRVFEHSRDEVFALVRTMRLDGGTLLDDYAGALKGGADATRHFFQRILTERVPGGDQTYLAEFIAIGQDVEDQLGRQLDKDQMRKLKSLRVDLLDVKTGYDPVGDYVRAKLQ